MPDDYLARLMVAARRLDPKVLQWLSELVEERLEQRITYDELCEAMTGKGVKERATTIMWSKLTGTNFNTSREVRFAPVSLAALLFYRGRPRPDQVAAQTWLCFQEWLEERMAE